MNVIEQIESQGITVSLAGDRIQLKPVEKVTPEMVAKVKASKAQILHALNSIANAGQPTACYCCGGQTFWRKKDNIGGRWICDVCHPPALRKDEIEWLQ